MEREQQQPRLQHPQHQQQLLQELTSNPWNKTDSIRSVNSVYSVKTTESGLRDVHAQLQCEVDENELDIWAGVVSMPDDRKNEIRSVLTRRQSETRSVKDIRSLFLGTSVPETEEAFQSKIRQLRRRSLTTKSGSEPDILNYEKQEKECLIRGWIASIVLEKNRGSEEWKSSADSYSISCTVENAVLFLQNQCGICENSVGFEQWQKWMEVIHSVLKSGKQPIFERSSELVCDDVGDNMVTQAGQQEVQDWLDSSITNSSDTSVVNAPSSKSISNDDSQMRIYMRAASSIDNHVSHRSESPDDAPERVGAAAIFEQTILPPGVVQNQRESMLKRFAEYDVFDPSVESIAGDEIDKENIFVGAGMGISNMNVFNLQREADDNTSGTVTPVSSLSDTAVFKPTATYSCEDSNVNDRLQETDKMLPTVTPNASVSAAEPTKIAIGKKVIPLGFRTLLALVSILILGISLVFTQHLWSIATRGRTGSSDSVQSAVLNEQRAEATLSVNPDSAYSHVVSQFVEDSTMLAHFTGEEESIDHGTEVQCDDKKNSIIHNNSPYSPLKPRPEAVSKFARFNNVWWFKKLRLTMRNAFGALQRPLQGAIGKVSSSIMRRTS